MRPSAFFVLTALWLAFISVPAAAQEAAVTDVLALVNNQPVYAWEVNLIMPQVQAEMARQGQQPDRNTVMQASLQQVIRSRLLTQEARRLGLTPNPERIEQTLREIEKQAGGAEQFYAQLGQMGVSPPQFRVSIIEGEFIRALVEETIQPEIQVTAQEVETFYNENPELFKRPAQVHARHILFKTTPEMSAEEKAAKKGQADAARKRVVAGEDFATLAKELSEGPSAPQGGDLGFFSHPRMVKPFADAAFALEAGGISEVVETQFGFHVIKVEERRTEQMQSLEDVREPLERSLVDQKTGAALNELLKTLGEKATILDPRGPRQQGAPTPPGGSN
jgi:peptidyl-prolyl cis-trans isomerase C